MARIQHELRHARRRALQPQEHVREIRDRYARALRMGYSVEDASRMANEGVWASEAKPTAPASSPTPRVVLPKTVPEVAEPAPTSIAGQATPPIDRDNIPPNWQDLPWPELRKLAQRLAPGTSIRSRTSAMQAIADALN